MQLKTSKTIQFFHNTFKNKFGFEDYTDRHKPTLFFGVYRGNDLKEIERHEGIKIIWFAGYDASVREMLLAIKNSSAFKDATIVAESKWIRNDLDAVGLKYESISLCMDNLYAWRAEPLGKSLYWYNVGNSRYGKQYFQAVKDAFPDLDIITNDSHTIQRDKINEVYAKCFAAIRPVEHDGMSQGVAEMALMGRYTIWNGDGPFAVHFEGLEGLIVAIKRLRELDYNYKLVAKRSRGYFISNETKWVNLVLRFCGTSELDITNIFYESVGRCGSEFRIQRKSDIEKFGGLGIDQMQRPWLSNQFIKIGKKQLLTSKNSGFIASEWKNIDRRKGFPEGIEFNTKDGRTI